MLTPNRIRNISKLCGRIAASEKPAFYLLLITFFMIAGNFLLIHYIKGISHVEPMQVCLMTGVVFLNLVFVVVTAVLLYMAYGGYKAGSILKEELHRFSRAVQQSPASIVITDLNGDITFINRKFTDVTGYTAEEAIGRNPRILKSGKQPDEIYKNLWNTITSGSEWRGELLNRKKNGDLYWEMALISPLRDREGKISHYLAVKEDITDRKKGEAELLRAIEAAEEASRLKSEFLANMSHEIRTPINGVIGMTDLLLETTVSEKQVEYLDIIKKSSDGLLKLFNNILEMSKIESNRLYLEEKVFSLSELIREAIKIHYADAYNKNLDLAYHISIETPDKILGDPSRLEQVLTCLLGNAVKFTHHGYIFLSISLYSSANGSLTLLSEVSDTGIGIPASCQSQIFSPFAQLDGSINRVYAGTGLGLSIANHLVNMMGGRLWFESEVGKGTRFYFTSNFHKANDERIRISITEFQQEHASVYIFDNHQATVKGLKSLLSDMNMVPQVFENKKQGIESLEKSLSTKTAPHIVIVDEGFVDVDLIDIFNQSKFYKKEAFPSIIILISHGSVIESAKKDNLEYTALHKPVSRESFLKTLTAAAPGVFGPGAMKIKLPAGITGTDDRQARNILMLDDDPERTALLNDIVNDNGYEVEMASDIIQLVDKIYKKPHEIVILNTEFPDVDVYQIRHILKEKEKSCGLMPIPLLGMVMREQDSSENALEDGVFDGYITRSTNPDVLFNGLKSYLRKECVQDSCFDLETNMPAIKTRDVLNLVEGDETLLNEIIDAFLKEAPRHVAEIEADIGGNDLDALDWSVQSFRGAASHLAAVPLVRVLDEMRASIKARSVKKIPELFVKMQREVKRLENSLNILLKETTGN